MPNKKKVDKIIEKEVDRRPNNITNCKFVGVEFDAATMEAVIAVADGLAANANALGSLAKMLNSGNVNVESMIKLS